MKRIILTLGLAVFAAQLSAKEIKETDLLMFNVLTKGDKHMASYKSDIAKMLNKLATTNPSCKKRIAPETTGISTEKSTAENPSFFVQCGDMDNIVVVSFTANDMRSGKTPPVAVAISKNEGLKICKEEAKRSANIPSSVDFSMLLDAGYDAKKNGNAIVSSSFSAKNALGVAQKFRIFCFFEQKKLVDTSVKPIE